MFKIYDEPDSPSKGGVFKIYDEPESPMSGRVFFLGGGSGGCATPPTPAPFFFEPCKVA